MQLVGQSVCALLWCGSVVSSGPALYWNSLPDHQVDISTVVLWLAQVQQELPPLRLFTWTSGSVSTPVVLWLALVLQGWPPFSWPSGRHQLCGSLVCSSPAGTVTILRIFTWPSGSVSTPVVSSGPAGTATLYLTIRLTSALIQCRQTDTEIETEQHVCRGPLLRLSLYWASSGSAAASSGWFYYQQLQSGLLLLLRGAQVGQVGLGKIIATTSIWWFRAWHKTIGTLKHTLNNTRAPPPPPSRDPQPWVNTYKHTLNTTLAPQILPRDGGTCGSWLQVGKRYAMQSSLCKGGNQHTWWCEQHLNPSSAEAFFVQRTRTQRFFEKHLNPVMMVFIG